MIWYFLPVFCCSHNGNSSHWPLEHIHKIYINLPMNGIPTFWLYSRFIINLVPWDQFMCGQPVHIKALV